jgi:hypothetical protein
MPVINSNSAQAQKEEDMNKILKGCFLGWLFLQLIFTLLKITGIVGWSWIVIALPTIAGIAIYMLVLVAINVLCLYD